MTVDPTVQPDVGPPTPSMFADLRRVHTSRGSHIEPPLDPAWSDHTRLLWCAAAVRVDHGIDIRIGPVHDGLFPISWDLPNGGSSGTAQPYRQSWEAITRMGEGADAARAADTRWNKLRTWLYRIRDRDEAHAARALERGDVETYHLYDSTRGAFRDCIDHMALLDGRDIGEGSESAPLLGPQQPT